MIVLYEVVPGPLGPIEDCGTNGRLGVDIHPPLRRWWDNQVQATEEAVRFCETLGPRPRPGIQHTRLFPVIVVETFFTSAAQAANVRAKSRKVVHTVWSSPNGSARMLTPCVRGEEGVSG